MLIDFTFKNFHSFKKEVTFSMLAANTVKENEGEEEPFSNTVNGFGNKKYLRVATVYGANASGKSNFIKAMAFFRNMILLSSNNENILEAYQDYFLFDNNSFNEPSSFEMNFIAENRKFRYGFEILKNQIESEWLFETKKDSQRENYCFIREKKKIKVNTRIFKGTRGLADKTRYNSLFLSTTAQFNVEISMLIKEFFRKSFNVLSGLDETIQYTAGQYMHDSNMRQEMLDFIKLIDLGIKDITVNDESVPYNEHVKKTIMASRILSPEVIEDIAKNGNLRKLEISTAHESFDEGNSLGLISFPFKKESLGTQKAFSFLGPWFDTLRRGGILIIDEFGTSLHTKLSKEFLRLFQSSLNLFGAQLIVTTHDTNLLHRDLLRRDQIWFTEKDLYGVSDLYSLVEYKINQASSVRNDASFSRDYLAGKYGAIPFLGDVERFIKEYSHEQ